MNYGTIKLPREEYDRHNERRQDLGLTWAAYVDGEAPESVDEHAIAQEVTDLVAAGEIRIDPGAIADAVAERVGGGGDNPVTLEASEYAKIADEVEGRMR